MFHSRKRNQTQQFIIGGILILFTSLLLSAGPVMAQAYTTYNTNKSSVNLSGTASSPVGLTRVSWTNDRGGGGNAVGTTNWSITGIVLQVGQNTIIITVWDSGGNSTADGLIINYTSTAITPTPTPTVISTPTPTTIPIPPPSSGGGGGGGNYFIPTPIPTTTTIVLPPNIGAGGGTLPPLSGPFSMGMQSNQVKILQQYLAKDPTIYPAGTIDGYYGPVVVKAVQRFQFKYGVVTRLDNPAYGLAGPATRAKITQVLGDKGSNFSALTPIAKEQLIAQIKQIIISLMTQIQALLQAQINSSR
ncbi:MAG: peptidoglycan-binding protein [Patescibacteria group bacterium]